MEDTKKSKNQGYFADDDEVMSDISMDESMTDESDEYIQKKTKGQQGFASMPKDRQKEIASKGGRAAHQQGTAHEWDSEEARAAGRKGGLSRKAGEEEVLEEVE